MFDVIVQIIGWIGMLLFLISYQAKSNRVLYLFQALGGVAFTLQFLLMGQFGGCLNVSLIIVRGFLLRKYNDLPWVRSKIWPALICSVAVIILIFTWTGPLSLLTFAAMVVSTCAFWTNNAGFIRASALFFGSPAWIIYDVIVGSWGGAASEVVGMLSVIVSIYRFGWKALWDKNSSFQK